MTGAREFSANEKTLKRSVRSWFVDIMASGVETPQVPSENPINSSPESIHVFDPAMLIDEDYDSDYLPGSRLADEQQFRNRRGGEVKLTPLLIDLRRLLSSKSERSVIKGVSILLHSVMQCFR